MLKQYASSEKMKYDLNNSVFNIYRSGDEQVRDILDESRSSRRLNLKSDDTDDPLQNKLAQKIIQLLTTESIQEK